ncbi:ferric reduction oxidase 7, chloroplastic-like protein [Tanacetum coccineum]
MSTQEPLIKNLESENSYEFVTKSKFLVKFTKWVLKFAMCLVFFCWVGFLLLLPSESVSGLAENFVEDTSGSVFWVSGTIFLYGGPIFVIAILGVLYLRISGEEEFQEKKRAKHASFRLWTFPVIVDGPFGIVTAAELIVILVVVVYLIWALSIYAVQNYSLIPYYEKQGKRNVMLKHTGLRFGSIGLICIAFMFLPVARGSILLRLINIPFEHATRYHIWLGHLTLTLFTLHGGCYVYSWYLENRVLTQLINWKNNSIANLPGVISLSAGLLMWVTSLPPVRRLNFELFFYTHQLYVVFIVFLAMHVGDRMFSVIAAGLFLYMLDRFLRFFQSRKTVDILSAKCLPSGTVELILAKPEGLRYNALSWVFLQVRELSWLQWHPFSVSSSPLDGKYHVAVLIKVLGNWTKKLQGHILSVEDGQSDQDGLVQPNLKLNASVEGPYGHESPYHLMYENLILVAGGIGISPFLAVLTDIVNRIKDSKPCMPRNVLIIWAVKTSEELPFLHSLDLNSLFPDTKLNLEIQTYVTQETQPPLEAGEVHNYVSSSVFSYPSRSGISTLVGTGTIMWAGTYVVVPTIGFIVSLTLLNVFYINPYGVSYRWYKGLLLLICMVASVVIFGGLVIGLWHFWDRKTSLKEMARDEKNTDDVQCNESTTHKGSSDESFVKSIKYGQRPDVKEIFGTMAKRWGNVDIGVIVCGPPTLRTCVAKECRNLPSWSTNEGRKTEEMMLTGGEKTKWH